MAEDDVEFGHVVDLTLGEPSGTELVADAAIGATTLTVDYAGDFEDAGEVVLNGATLSYTSIAYGAAETDPDVITLAAPLVAAAVVDDKAVRVSGGEPLSDWLLHVSLGDGHPVDIPIPFEQRALWSSVDTSTPVPVMVSADLERLVEVPGRTPVVDGAFIDPTSTIPGGQAFSLDAPTATDGYPEDYGWWQVDATGNVLGFWRLVGGAWVQHTVAPVLVGETINGVTITGSTVTGLSSLFAGPTGDPRVIIRPVVLDVLDEPGIVFDPVGNDPSDLPVHVSSGPGILTVSAGRANSGDTHPRYQVSRDFGVIAPHLFSDGDLRVADGDVQVDQSLNVDGTLTTVTFNAAAGSVGTGTFRDSVRAALTGNYAAAWTTYTPTFTAATTNPTLGNFTRAGRYLQVGKRVNFTIVITCNSTTGLGSGAYEFGLPVAARAADEVVAQAVQTAPVHIYLGRGASTSTLQFYTVAEANMNSVTSGMTTGAVLRISGTYEAA